MKIVNIKWIALFCFLMFSCRGTTMKDPPIHIIQNMDDVGRLDPQSQNFASYLIEDSVVFISPHKMSMMKPVEGTVPRGNDDFIADDEFIRTKHEIESGTYISGKYLRKIPKEFKVDQSFLDRGKERYDIYCSVCHGATGDGKGAVTNEIFSWHRNLMPANYHDPSDVNMENWNKDGYLYSVVANGVGNMNGYASQISVEDRWKIVAYVRSLEYAYKKRYAVKRDKVDLIKALKNFNTIEQQLLSDEFEELVGLDKSDPKNIIQTFFGKKTMVEVQRIIKTDSPVPDGIWGEGSKRKWAKWKKDQLSR